MDHADLAIDLRKHHPPFDSAFAITLHPQFARNRFAFFCYMEPGGRTNGSIIARFTILTNDPPTVDPGGIQ